MKQEVKDKIEAIFDECFDANTSPTGGGYEADYTHRQGLWDSFSEKLFAMLEEYAAQSKGMPESTQEGGTVEAEAKEYAQKEEYGENMKPHVESAFISGYEYASQVSATDKKRIDELEKEVERLRGLVGDAWYQSKTNCELENGAGEGGDKYVSFKDFKANNNL